ncbi:DUF2156 domain-containing protein [Gryllotalpicola protaetiae]|uniref:DUF2156 domain-containing protein n=2 Tax=Gryllotalpicola protaetiae TaxID=2419771 RepID=A0A387BML7_9MICO|nr:DUF2156 domain-containing protein [Gryllotalpicola protaetiae]
MRHPFSSTMAAVYLVVALVTAPFAGPDGLLRQRLWVVLGSDEPVSHWWSPMTGTLIARGLPELTVAVVGSLVLLGASERLMGWRRTAVAFAVTAIVGTTAGAGLIVLGELDHISWARSIARIATVDPQSGIFGAIATASAFAGALWRRRIRLVVVLVSLVFLLYSGEPADVYRLTATLAGLALGLVLTRRRRPGWARSSRHEVRRLLAAATALTAVGPMIALFSRSRVGPLGPIGMLLAAPDAQSPRQIAARCDLFQLTHACVGQLTLARIAGPGPIVVSVVPLMLLLLAAWGLVRGRRFAVWLAVGIEVLLGGLAAVYFGLLPAVAPNPAIEAYRDVQFQFDAVISIGLPLVMAAALLVARRSFAVPSDGRAVAGFAVAAAGALLALGGGYLVVLLLGGTHVFGAHPGVGRLVASASERFVPVSFLGGDGALVVPLSPGGRLLGHLIGPLFWLVVAGAALRPLFGAGPRQLVGDAAPIRRIVESGGDALSFMSQWPGNARWIAEDGAAAVAYRVVGRIALTVGGPIGRADDPRAVIEGFARHCDDNGWMPVFYSVDAGLSTAFAALGWQHRAVADEAVLNPTEIDFGGRRWQKVRSAVNRADREGIRSLWSSLGELPWHLARQLEEISEEWVSNKELPEMGFTLGGLDEARDPVVRLMVAVDSDERVHAFTSWLPVYRDGVVVGYTNDLMRRRRDGAHGAMEFVIAEVIARLRNEGIGMLSLSAAPLARVSAAESDGLDDLLDRLSRRLEPAYGFRSLLDFKLKFQPELRPLLIAYPDAAALPEIGIALVRAYLPSLSLAQASRLVRGLWQEPVSRTL